MNPQNSLWLAVAYTVVIVGSAIRNFGRTLRLRLIVAFLTAIGISAWLMIGKLR